MRYYLTAKNIICAIAICFAVNCFIPAKINLVFLWPAIAAFTVINLFLDTRRIKTGTFRINICNHGITMLIIFIISVIVTVIYHTVMAFLLIPNDYMTLIWSAVVSVSAHIILFWNSILSIYLTSYQLGIKRRVVGVIGGLIPLVNLFVLGMIIKIVMDEVRVEVVKDEINRARRGEAVCQTKYPILLVHGVFLRDFRFFNYWGRIPHELKLNGAKIFYGKHHSAASVAECAKELADRIDEILKATGSEKVNVIAHSKGGLDMRYAIANLGMESKVASLTTVNTPHRGCLYADDLLKKTNAPIKWGVAKMYNRAYRILGDKKPDLMSALKELTAEACAKFNEVTPTPEGIFCQSVGSVLNKAESGKFPLNITYEVVDHYNEEGILNDGLVSESSFEWGEKYTLITVKGDRGVSHVDIIDLNRDNLDEFDVREFYVDLVSDLKSRGF